MATTKNGEVVDLLQTIGDLMELRGDESFRVRAYREAARQLDQVTEDIEALSREGRLTDIKGVGPSIARTVQEFLETGDAAQRQRLSQEVPESLIELLGLRHFGPQRIVRVHRALGVTTLDELEAAARDGRLLTVSGFGARSVETLLQAIATFREQRKRIPRYLAESVAAGAVHGLRQMAGLGAKGRWWSPGRCAAGARRWRRSSCWRRRRTRRRWSTPSSASRCSGRWSSRGPRAPWL